VAARQDYKNYILFLMFYKRLSDQWDHEADEAINELERQQGRGVHRARARHLPQAWRAPVPDSRRVTLGRREGRPTNIGEVPDQPQTTPPDGG
jgi:type I restriction enzyme M protein